MAKECDKQGNTHTVSGQRQHQQRTNRVSIVTYVTTVLHFHKLLQKLGFRWIFNYSLLSDYKLLYIDNIAEGNRLGRSEYKAINLYGLVSTTSALNTLIFGRAPLDFVWASSPWDRRRRHSLSSCSSCFTRSVNASTELIFDSTNSLIDKLRRLR